VDGRLDVLDEGGGALVLGRRVAVHAAHVLYLPSGVGDDVLRPRRAAADETHHLRLLPPAQPRLRSGGCFASPASLQLLAPFTFACLLARLAGWMRTRERERGKGSRSGDSGFLLAWASRSGDSGFLFFFSGGWAGGWAEVGSGSAGGVRHGRRRREGPEHVDLCGGSEAVCGGVCGVV
jgi:hypothetical protein